MLSERMLEKEPEKKPINVSAYRMSREEVADEVSRLERIKEAAEIVCQMIEGHYPPLENLRDRLKAAEER